ncbi:MAG: DGQHR domain-containing protein [Chloroflexi bacterium]|nr:DGQHR domain-containing protein [Chloroflexota bacterium]
MGDTPIINEAEQIVDKVFNTTALEIKQNSQGYHLYVFIADGKEMAKQLGVRRMKWHKGKFKAEGFQRSLDNNRVGEIATYLSKNAILPNALVVAFEEGTLEFVPLPGQKEDSSAKFGHLTIKGKLINNGAGQEPVPEAERIGYVIDGQHRLKAIESSTLAEGSFPIIVSAFYQVDARFQLGQFYALNQTVRISSALLALIRRELGLQLSAREAYKKAVSVVCEILQNRPASPFEPEKYVGTPIYKGPLNITVVEAMVERAIKNTNLKWKWNQNANLIPVSDLEYIGQALYVYWKGISDLFPNDWGKKPKDQRLFCAIGLYTMIQFFDKVMENIDTTSAHAVQEVKNKLAPIKDIPWGKMQAIPSTPKATFRPEHFFDAIKDLWAANGARPYQMVITDPSGAELVNLQLTGP